MSASVSLLNAAAILGVTRRSVYSYIRAGRLRTVRVGLSQRVLAESLQAQCALQAARAADGVNRGGRPPLPAERA
jgi:excisionase family DNA binding protein